MKLGISQPPHYPIADVLFQYSADVQSRCGRHGLSNILKLQAMFLYSFITNEQIKLISFIWEGVDLMLLILDVPLINYAKYT